MAGDEQPMGESECTEESNGPPFIAQHAILIIVLIIAMAFMTVMGFQKAISTEIEKNLWFVDMMLLIVIGTITTKGYHGDYDKTFRNIGNSKNLSGFIALVGVVNIAVFCVATILVYSNPHNPSIIFLCFAVMYGMFCVTNIRQVKVLSLTDIKARHAQFALTESVKKLIWLRDENLPTFSVYAILTLFALVLPLGIADTDEFTRRAAVKYTVEGAAIGAAIVHVVSSTVGYWRSTTRSANVFDDILDKSETCPEVMRCMKRFCAYRHRIWPVWIIWVITAIGVVWQAVQLAKEGGGVT